MENSNPQRKTTVRLTFEERRKLSQLIKSGFSNAQIQVVMPRVTNNNIYGVRAALGIREYKYSKHIVQAPVTTTEPQPVIVQQELFQEPQAPVSYNINGVNVQLSKSPKSITVNNNSLTFQF